MLDVVIVVYRPNPSELLAAIQGLAQTARTEVSVRLWLWHNDEPDDQSSELAEACRSLQSEWLTIRVTGRRGNLGFGRAINACLAGVDAPFTLLLNQDAVPEPGALEALYLAATLDDRDVAAWEMRQIPYEHPKDYDPVSGETGWFSGAAVLLRTAALRQVGGFEPRFFMYCEDVDLSWRLRCAGWRLRYVPQAAVVHRTYSRPAEIKPLMVTEGRFANLCLRTRFAGRRQVLQGLRAVRADLKGPEAFDGHHRSLQRALLKFARHYAYFRRTRSAGPAFEPLFVGWDFEQRREGAFHPFASQAERSPGWAPRIAVLLHTRGSRHHLHERLACLAGQTLAPHEVVVVVDDAPGVGDDERVHSVLRHWSAHLPLLRVCASEAAAEASLVRLWTTADWLLILPDDETRLYADHLEVLAQAAQSERVDRVRALGWHLHAKAADAVQAHRTHRGRSLLRADTSSAGQLRHRRLFDPGAGTVAAPRTVDIEKLTWLRYDADDDAAAASAAETASR